MHHPKKLGHDKKGARRKMSFIVRLLLIAFHACGGLLKSVNHKSVTSTETFQTAMTQEIVDG